MRTTINLPDELIAQIKKLAVASNSTVTAIIEDALREALARRRRTGRQEQVILKTYGRGGLLPGVGIDDHPNAVTLAPGERR